MIKKLILCLSICMLYFNIQILAKDLKLQIEVNIILAQKTMSGIDTRLKDLSEKLKPILNYSSYRLVSSENITPKMGETSLISLPGKQNLLITPLRIKHKRLSVKIEKQGINSFETVIRLGENGNFLCKGANTKEGEIIISTKLISAP